MISEREKRKNKVHVFNVRKVPYGGVNPGQDAWVDKQTYEANKFALKQVQNRPQQFLEMSGVKEAPKTPSNEKDLSKERKPKEKEKVEEEKAITEQPAEKSDDEKKTEVEKPKGKISRKILAQAFAEAVGSKTKAAVLLGVDPKVYLQWCNGDNLRTRKYNVKKRLDWFYLNAYLNYNQTLLFKDSIIKLVEERLEEIKTEK